MLFSELAKRLGIDENNEVYVAAKQAAKARYKRAEKRYCANGCTNYYDPLTDEVFAGFGKPGCELCDDY